LDYWSTSAKHDSCSKNQLFCHLELIGSLQNKALSGARRYKISEFAPELKVPKFAGSSGGSREALCAA